MKLFLVKRTDDFGYEQAAGFVVRAENEAAARSLATQDGNGYPEDIWDSPSTVVTEITGEGEPGVILMDFHAG